MPQKKFHDVFIVVEINKPTNIVDIPAPLQQQHSKEIDGSLQDRDSLLCRIQHPIWSPKLLLRSFTMQPPEDVSAPPEIEPSSIQVLWWPQTMSSNFGIAPENFSDLFLKNIASYPNQILLVMGILGCCSRVQSAARSTWPMQTPRPWSWSKRSRVTHTRWIVSLGTKKHNYRINMWCFWASHDKKKRKNALPCRWMPNMESLCPGRRTAELTLRETLSMVSLQPKLGLNEIHNVAFLVQDFVTVQKSMVNQYQGFGFQSFSAMYTWVG